MNGYSPEARDAHFDRELDEHLKEPYGGKAGDEYEEKLPDFLYINFAGEVAISQHSESVVTEEWNAWLEKNGVEL